MKSRIFFIGIFATMLLIGCQKGKFAEEKFAKENELIVKDQKDILQMKFAKVLSIAVANNSELRSLIKTEALKNFDNDDDVLYQLIRGVNIGENTVSELLSSYAESEEEFKTIEESLPLLTILVPTIPNFTLEGWNPTTEIPQIAVRLIKNSEVPLYDNNGNQTMIPSGAVPGFPILVVKQNERLKVNSSSDLKSAEIYASDGKFAFNFLDSAFDGSKLNRNKEKRLMFSQTEIDPVNIEAYNSGVEWHRDYVYYGLTPTITRGAFRENYYEYITSFTMLGSSWYGKIADQTGDPKISTNNTWTDGAFEFKVTVLLNATNGVGTTIDKYFSAKGSDLVKPSYSTYSGRQGGPITVTHYYILNSIISKPYNPNLELVKWNLKEYGSSWKISISEIDNPEEYTNTEEISSTFATNFEISATGGILEKVGLKFGASATNTSKSTFSVKTSLTTDILGDAILNFSDPIIIGEHVPNSGSSGRGSEFYAYQTNEINTGWVSLSIEPKKKY